MVYMVKLAKMAKLAKRFNFTKFECSIKSPKSLKQASKVPQKRKVGFTKTQQAVTDPIKTLAENRKFAYLTDVLPSVLHAAGIPTQEYTLRGENIVGVKEVNTPEKY